MATYQLHVRVDQKWIGNLQAKGFNLCMAMATVVDNGEGEVFNTAFRVIEIAPTMTATWEEEYSISWTPETLARGYKIERESNSRYISKGQMCELRQDGEMRIEDGGGNVDGQSIGFRTDTAASVILSIKVGGDGSAGTPIYASEEVVVPGTGTVLTPVPGKVRLWLQNHVDTGSLLRQTLSACFDVTVEPGEMTTACFDANGHWVLDTN